MPTHYEKPPYLLLTPGPLSTSPSVRGAMWYDSCTWDHDYKHIVTTIRSKLLTLSECDANTYTVVLMQGSGSFGVEAVLGSSVHRNQHNILILVNGVYGKRMVQMANALQIPHIIYETDDHKIFELAEVEKILEQDPSITHIAMVHCETTSGILNPLKDIAFLAKKYDKHFIVDAMSSFGGIPIDISHLNIDFLISSANKCIQGVPGFSFVICKREKLKLLCKDNAKSLVLDLYSQWEEMEKDSGKWRYTSPTHTVLAFHQALIELEQEGGIKARSTRYALNQKIIADGLESLGFETYVDHKHQSCIITTFIQPEKIPGSETPFCFNEFYQHLKQQGFVIYPGKVAHKNSFRIGSIGHLFAEDMIRFIEKVREYTLVHCAI